MIAWTRVTAAIGLLLVTTTAGFAGTAVAPAPLIGLTDPYGMLAAAAAVGGFMVYRKLRERK